jgi:hypothetical protein
MARQLHLLSHSDENETPRDWRLDEATRTLGFQGVAQARAALRAARSAHQHTAGATSDTRRSAA